MTYRFTRKTFIVFAAIAFTSAVFWFARSSSQPVSAQLRDGSVAFIYQSVVGMIPDQSVRVCIGTTHPRGPELDWFVRFSDQHGTLLFQLPEQRSPSGEWRCGNVARSMLPVAGDAGTGRAQVAMQVVVEAPAGTKPSEIIGSSEIIDGTGGTTAYLMFELENALISGFTVG